MKWIWIFLWVALSAIQLLAFGVKRFMEAPLPPQPAPHENQLLELARKTNHKWAFMEDTHRLDGAYDGLRIDSTKGISREDWILHLSELQRECAGSELEQRLLKDLEQWLSASTMTGKEMDKIDVYLSTVLNWLNSFRDKDSMSMLEKVGLEPEATSDYPGLYFELSGIPESMGEMLYRASGKTSVWKVNRLDLYRHENTDTWWLQGNCLYEPDGRG